MIRIFLIASLIFFQLYAIVESASTLKPRLMPRWAWVVVTVTIPLIGPILWFMSGRRYGKGFGGPRRRGPIGPDDDTDFLKSI
jgi:hypothetical protein